MKATITSRTTRGIYYVKYPPRYKIPAKATDQLRIAELHCNLFNAKIKKLESIQATENE